MEAVTNGNGSHPNYKRETESRMPSEAVDDMPIIRPDKYLDCHRAAYLSEHAPGILAALIMRRASTDPAQLVELAVRTAGMLYDVLKSGTT